MSTPEPSISLIEKAAERLRGATSRPLVERAAERLETPSEAPPQPAPVIGPATTAARSSPPEPASPLISPSGLVRPRSSRSEQIDLTRLQRGGMIVPGAEKTQISEEFRLIKRPLLLKAAAEEGRNQNDHLILVTSAQPGEGKTFTSINLAMSIASEPDLHVLLVDADVHRSSVPRALGLEVGRGLLDLLTDESLDLADVLIRCSNLGNLTILGAGTPRAHSTELFASQRMEAIVADISRRYTDRIIIFDTPPLLVTTEASVLALHVGQVVLVVEAEHTSQQAIEGALELVSGCPNVSMVLNKTKISLGSDEFGSYSQYGYYYKSRS